MPAIAESVHSLGELRPILELVPSPLNPRKSFDKAKLDELAASIASKGIIEPLIVRSRPGLAQLEIVAGERRYRAAKIAKHDLVPVIIRHLSDVEVLELMAIENSQRDDLHPLEEADGYAALMKADRAYTPKAIAAKIGKSERYVQQRLQLATLDGEVKKAFLANHITAGHAELICRLKPEDQKAALKACFHNLYGEDKERGCISVRQLNTWIEHNVRLHLTKDDPQTQAFPELAKLVETPKEGTVPSVLEVAGSYLPSDQAQKLGVLNSSDYRAIEGKKDRCPHAQRAFVAIGNERGRLIDICTARTECNVHWRWEIEAAERDRKASKSTLGSKTRAKHDKAATEARKKAAEQERQRREQAERRDRVRDRAIVLLKKQILRPGPALLALLRATSYWDAKTWTDIAVRCVSDDLFINNDHDWKKAAAILKPFGIKLDAIERELAATAETQASAPAKKAGKSKKAAA